MSDYLVLSILSSIWHGSGTNNSKRVYKDFEPYENSHRSFGGKLVFVDNVDLLETTLAVATAIDILNMFLSIFHKKPKPKPA